MEGGKNQLGPNVGAVDIIHNQSVAGGDKSTSFTFRFSVCLLVRLYASTNNSIS